MIFGFAFRIALILVPILIIGIIVSSALSLYNFGQTFSNLLDSRFEFVTSEVRDNVQSQMDLGLPLENLEIAEVLEQYTLDDQRILTIEVFDERGVVLHSSDASSVGDIIPDEWLSLSRLHSDSSSWSTQEVDAGVVGTVINNNLGQNVGSLVLRYSRDYLDQMVYSQALRQLTVNSIAAGITLLVGLIGAMLLLHRTGRDLRLMAETMNSLANEEEKESSFFHQVDSRLPTFGRFVSSVLATYKDMDNTIAKAKEFDEK